MLNLMYMDSLPDVLCSSNVCWYLQWGVLLQTSSISVYAHSQVFLYLLTSLACLSRVVSVLIHSPLSGLFYPCYPQGWRSLVSGSSICTMVNVGGRDHSRLICSPYLGWLGIEYDFLRPPTWLVCSYYILLISLGIHSSSFLKTSSTVASSFLE